METGCCVGWKENQGFGFIRPDLGGADVFVHRRDITNASELHQGTRVSFEIMNDARRNKPRADKVRVIDDASRKQPGTADGFDAIAYDNNFLLTAD
jgi:CspA family cold shock protein